MNFSLTNGRTINTVSLKSPKLERKEEALERFLILPSVLNPLGDYHAIASRPARS